MRAIDYGAWWDHYGFYSPEDPEDGFEPVGPYTSEDLAFLMDARIKEDADLWTSEPPRTGE